MDFQTFKSIINTLEKSSEDTHALYKLNVDLINYNEPLTKVINILLLEVFQEEGKDWIDWYLYERKSYSGETLKAFDKNNKEICNTIESLWEVVQEHIE
jgi:hypothetical protein